MNSIQTKTKIYKKFGTRHCIAAVLCIPSNDPSFFDIYVAWENEPAANSGFFSFQFTTRNRVIDEKTLITTCDFGIGIPETMAKKLFPYLFKSPE